MSNKKVWFVTGASKGLGRDLVKKLLAGGYRVAATSRNLDELSKIATDDNFLPLSMQVTDEASVAKALADTVVRFGRVDVVVNNAGYGLAGSIEELSDSEARGNFDINVFGTLNVIRKVLPYFRAQKSGHIFNVSSIAGFIGSFPGFGIYCATKFAVDGLSESLATEVKPFGIHVTIVSPGYFRTDFLAGSSLGVPATPIADYTQVREQLARHQNEINHNQPGDPEKAAAAFIEVSEAENPPVHLFLGEDAYNMVYTKIDAIKEEVEAWKATTVNTGF
ncbi:SDR family NAD(P)-dependent oxidoreductase [Chitinophaga varians]|uniref:SDR family NAD(P)-dependent oxidoreductase n=1 Tax=Chitinophaga varians TaxID=2202339 RepID=A0A847S0D7_9BACT|nr:oxidoreductase [Chitinophaga varians]NLR66337.1 SDR family NAD(P)-dependent oxidoreductase [Chitinophaga varians]